MNELLFWFGCALIKSWVAYQKATPIHTGVLVLFPFLEKKSLFKLKEGDYNIVHKALRRINAGCEQAKYCVKT